MCDAAWVGEASRLWGAAIALIATIEGLAGDGVEAAAADSAAAGQQAHIQALPGAFHRPPVQVGAAGVSSLCFAVTPLLNPA